MSTKVMTGIVRFSYVNIAEPKSINGSKPKYSVSLIIPKDDKDTINKIEAAIETAIQEGVGKFGGKIPPRCALKLPLRDGDTEREDEAYKNSYFVNANSTTKPGVVDRNANYIDAEQVYSGAYGRDTITFFGFNTNGYKGVACGLGNLQLVRDGEPLGGRASAADEFAAFSDDGTDDFLA